MNIQFQKANFLFLLLKIMIYKYILIYVVNKYTYIAAIDNWERDWDHNPIILALGTSFYLLEY